ncbi:hypothetical protein VN97_g3247 [Penicillium thymicola]|uniref:Uncharacterized protein n=1 Tax=Penicillium thymicola TaxID=293382 RepID=A0AAI9XAF9_PENTH|nr:hypothetical protein VN97_g3247 [Penicillium thymicola]
MYIRLGKYEAVIGNSFILLDFGTLGIFRHKLGQKVHWDTGRCAPSQRPTFVLARLYIGLDAQSKTE